MALHDLDNAQKEKVLKQQEERLTASVKYMETLYPQMLENYKKYRSIADPIVDDLGNEVTDEPNLFVPYPYGIVESELPRLAGKLPRIRIAPRKDIDKKAVEKRQDYLYYAFDRMKFLQTQTLWLRQYGIYGWSPLYYYWREEISKVLTVEESEMGGKALVKKEVKRYDDFWCKVIDVFDAFLQPRCTSPEEGDWFIFRENVSKQDLKKLVESGKFYEEVEDFLKDDRKPDEGKDTGRASRDALIAQDKDASPHAYGKYELYWCFEDERVICTLGTNILCMVSDNPHPLQKKPILNCNLTEMVSEPIGISTIEALAGLPDKLNALTNARLKNISLMLSKVFLANRNAQADWDNFVMEGGNIIFTNDLENTVKELEFKDNAISSEREVLTSKEEMQFSVGVSDYIVGVKSGARLTDTATGVSTIVREANARYGLKQASYESGCLRELVLAADCYSKLYLTDQKQVYVLGPDGFKTSVITPEDLAWDADIMVEPGSVVPLDQASLRENLINLLDRVITMPGIVRVDKYMQRVLESNDFRNADELIISQEQDADPLMNDYKLAVAENISLSMGQPVKLTGNDDLHIAAHNTLMQANLPPQILEVVKAHLQAHTEHREALMQQQIAAQLAGQMGGSNAQPENQNQASLPNIPGAVQAAGGAGAGPAMGGPGGMAGKPGGGSVNPLQG